MSCGNNIPSRRLLPRTANEGDSLIYTIAQGWKPAPVASGSASIESMLHTDLLDKFNAAELKPGTIYKITDFQTVHDIPNTSDVNTGPVEPLLVLAVSESKFAPVTWSEEFPGDILYYDIARTDFGATKGYIWRRYDSLRNIDLFYDWRAWVFRRWGCDLTEYNGGSVEYWLWSTPVFIGWNQTDDDTNSVIEATDENDYRDLLTFGMRDPDFVKDFYMGSSPEPNNVVFIRKGTGLIFNFHAQTGAYNSTIILPGESIWYSNTFHYFQECLFGGTWSYNNQIAGHNIESSLFFSQMSECTFGSGIGDSLLNVICEGPIMNRVAFNNVRFCRFNSSLSGSTLSGVKRLVTDNSLAVVNINFLDGAYYKVNHFILSLYGITLSNPATAQLKEVSLQKSDFSIALPLPIGPEGVPQAVLISPEQNNAYGTFEINSPNPTISIDRIEGLLIDGKIFIIRPAPGITLDIISTPSLKLDAGTLTLKGSFGDYAEFVRNGSDTAVKLIAAHKYIT